mmetsp:Transcript_76598/g.212800  ORF Transcript_76598/g.212800 Transcript_76598/m.212800 type:complete len:211 (+) Transcript_76598:2087-2719(+)
MGLFSKITTPLFRQPCSTATSKTDLQLPRMSVEARPLGWAGAANDSTPPPSEASSTVTTSTEGALSDGLEVVYTSSASFNGEPPESTDDRLKKASANRPPAFQSSSCCGEAAACVLWGHDTRRPPRMAWMLPLFCAWLHGEITGSSKKLPPFFVVSPCWLAGGFFFCFWLSGSDVRWIDVRPASREAAWSCGWVPPARASHFSMPSGTMT